MRVGQLRGEGRVIGVQRFPTHPPRRALDRVRDEHAACSTARCSSSADEDRDGVEDLVGSGEEAVVHAQLGPPEADHHRPIARQAATRYSPETMLLEAGEELDGVSRRARRKGELELRMLLSQTQQPLQRSKHFLGPGAKRFSADDQMYVSVVIDVVSIVITFSDEGRPPRERLETVPAVEITVPFLVCSTKWMASW